TGSAAASAVAVTPTAKQQASSMLCAFQAPMWSHRRSSDWRLSHRAASQQYPVGGHPPTGVSDRPHGPSETVTPVTYCAVRLVGGLGVTPAPITIGLPPFSNNRYEYWSSPLL